MGKSTVSPPTFEVMVGSRSVPMPVQDHKFVGTLCVEVLSRLKLGRDLSKWEFREADGSVVPFHCTEHHAGLTAKRHYYLIQVVDGKHVEPGHGKRWSRRPRH